MECLEIGQIVRDTYEVERFLGEGAFAEVYRVKHRFLGRQAMKVLKAPGMSVKELEGLLNEALILSRIGHPNIVRVFDANTLDTPHGTRGFFTMEYVAGGTLHDYWTSHDNRLVPVDTTIDIVTQVCRGLSVAHNESPPLIHRDIKPQNILVGYDTTGLRIRISDFGLAKRVNPLTLLASARGTPCFKAPEAFSDSSTDSRESDIWSIGVLFHLLLTDRMPFSTDSNGRPNHQALFDTSIRPSTINFSVSSDLDSIVLRALRPNPKDRYNHAGQMLEQLEKLSRDSATEAPLRDVSSAKGGSPEGLANEDRINESAAAVDIQEIIQMAKDPGKLMEAADLLEEALNQAPHLRSLFESRLKLWRRGVVM